ncbi:hypothetical protein V2K54_04525 [Pseudomonas alliivorans]|nr:hypothetical protein [Pseudomonas alliivorans]MEE5172956.1 hypothetical protein [Pseudomonas alliivorans]
MAKPSYTEADQERLAQAWIDSGLPITVWCAGEDDGVKRPNIQTFRKWPAVAAENERRAKEKGGTVQRESPNAPRIITPNITAVTTLDDVEAAYKATIENLITSLEQREAQLKGEMDRVVCDLARARDKLTKLD